MDIYHGGGLHRTDCKHYDLESPRLLLVVSERELREIAGSSAPVAEDAKRILAAHAISEVKKDA